MNTSGQMQMAKNAFLGPNLPQRNINVISKSDQQDLQDSESKLMIFWCMGTGDSMAEEVAEHSCIFRCLLQSTNMVKLNKLKPETAAKLHTAHPCFYCRRYELNLKSNSEDSTAKKMQLWTEVISVCWHHFFWAFQMQTNYGFVWTVDKTATQTLLIQHSLPKELVNKDTNLRMLSYEKEVFSAAECRLSFPRAGQYWCQKTHPSKLNGQLLQQCLNMKVWLLIVQEWKEPEVTKLHF